MHPPLSRTYHFYEKMIGISCVRDAVDLLNHCFIGSEWRKLRVGIRITVGPFAFANKWHLVVATLRPTASLRPSSQPTPSENKSLRRTEPSFARLNHTAQGTSASYLDTVHHRVSLEDLAPGTRFFYRCGHPSPAYDTGASDSLPTVDVHRTSGSAIGAGVDSTEAEAHDVAGYDPIWSRVSSFVAAPEPERCAADRY